MSLARCGSCSHRNGPPEQPSASPPVAPVPDSTTSAAGRRVLFDRKSPFGRVIVVETAERRCLKFSLAGGDQSCIDRRDPQRVVHEYVRYVPVGLLFTPPSPKTLMVGLGGGRVVELLLDHDPALVMDVVEIDPVVVEVADRYFGVDESPRLRIHVADGRAFFADRDERWDLIVLDAFGNDFIPFHLTTAEYLRIVAAHLTGQGAVVANLWTRNDELFRTMVKTYAAVFDEVYVFRAIHVGNAIVVGTAGEGPSSCAEVEALARARADQLRFPFPFEEQPRQCASARRLDLEGLPVLTDGGRQAFEDLGPL